MSFSSDASEVIPYVVSATEGILKAAAEQPEKSIKRVVLTSSSSAALLPQPGVEGIVVTKGKYMYKSLNVIINWRTYLLEFLLTVVNGLNLPLN